ncbi:GRIN2-like protein [Centroberyx affinis]|uniref:GRIN2-like protein n=1 Tax=Centroberyx affinis TaxID=166261 RepID=UPI003A5BB099
MGSLKDEMRGLTQDRQPCEMTEDRGSSDSSSTPQINTSPESTAQEDDQPKLHMNTSCVEKSDREPTSKDPAVSAGVCANHPDSTHVKDCTQTDAVPLTQQPEADQTSTASPSAVQNEETISTQSTPNKFASDLSPTDGGAELQGERSVDKNTDQSIEKEAENKNERLPVSSAPDPSVPLTPAPFGQHHMRTQVSLEVVQCHSVATSPMTPPDGDHAFYFPNSFGRSGAVGTETKDAELQVGQQVEFCSVATSPMTPKTPSTTAFPELSGRETGQMEEKMMKSVEQGQTDHVQKQSFPVTKSPADAESELIPALKFTTPKQLTEGTGSNSTASPQSSISCPAVGLTVTLEDSNQQCKQQAQRMGSMDQDITILVTHHDSTEAEDDDGGVKIESSIYPIGVELVKIDEYVDLSANSSEAEEKTIDIKEETMKKISTEISNNGTNVDPGQVQDAPLTSANPPQNKIKIEEPSQTDNDPLDQSKTSQNSGGKENKEDACFSEELKEVSQTECSLTKPLVPSSPAPSGCHHIRTQVSLEVVQCHSVATSPMTPPEGDHAFYFPNSLGRSGAVGAETKDAELQVGQQVEFRSVATAPMTPKTPTITAFPEIRKEESIEEKTVEEEEEEDKDKKESVTTERPEDKEEVLIEQEKLIKEEKADEAATEKKEEKEISKETSEEECEEKSEEPVQEVSWDEKGMTWEVYGAVVEVAVLGSAIQKHLEKQVKKHRKQASLPPPPPLNPSAMPLASASAQGCSGKSRAGKRGERDGKVSRRRRNPFRLLLQNMQQPHCCSRAHTTE